VAAGIALLGFLSLGWTSSGDDVQEASFSEDVAGADVNGDGFVDVMIASAGTDYVMISPTAPGELRRPSAVYAFLGSATGLAPAPGWSVTGLGVQGLGEGAPVLATGDFNRDGYGDVVVGVPGPGDDSPTDGSCNPSPCTMAQCAGSAYLFLGSPTGLGHVPTWTAHGDGVAYERFGASVSAGDVNGDGYDDVVVGADNHWALWPACPGTGRAYVYLGGAGGLAASYAWMSSGDSVDHSLYGASVSTGDLNGDGFDEVIVGAPQESMAGAGGSLVPKVFVYSGSASGPASTPSWTADGVGFLVSAHGDLDGNGYDDLITVGSTGMPAVAGVYGYPGSHGGMPATPTWSFHHSPDSRFFRPLSSAGDVNGDGFDDLVIGESQAPASTYVGAAYLYLGGGAGPSASPTWVAGGEMTLTLFGATVSIVGDVNRDGHADVVVGAPQYSTTHPDAGKAYLYFGASTPTGVCDRAGATCDDGNVCTATSACNADGLCEGTTFVSAGTACDDHDPRTIGDACDGMGVCRGTIRSVDGGRDDADQAFDGGPDGSRSDGGAAVGSEQELIATGGGCACDVARGQRLRSIANLGLVVVFAAVAARRCKRSRSQ
jgi:hypothetical protein